MTKSVIRFKAKLLRPAMEPARPPRADQRARTGGSWTFLVLPKNASAKLPSRGMTAIEGTINGVPFQAVLEPDGQKSHWLKVDRKLTEAAGAEEGDVVRLKIAPAAKEPEPKCRQIEKSSRDRRPKGKSSVGKHHTHRAPRLDPVDHLRQAGRDARAPDQKCLLHARGWEAPPLLLRPVRVLRQKLERCPKRRLRRTRVRRVK